MNPLRIGIIGYGVQGKLYSAILCGTSPVAQPKDIQLTAICDPNEFSAPNDSIHVYHDWKQLLQDATCDAVILTVPHRIHVPIALEALRHHKHVLCEKPTAIFASEARELLKAKQESTIQIAMMFNQRTWPSFRYIKEIIHNQTLGTLRDVYWLMNQSYRPDTYYDSSAWRGTWKQEGGGILVNQVAHHLDLLLWLCGTPSQVHSHIRNGMYRNMNVDNDVCAQLFYENHLHVTFQTVGYDPLGTDRLELSFSKGKLILENGIQLTKFTYTEEEDVWNQSYSFPEMIQKLRNEPQSLYTKETLSFSNSYFAQYVEIFEAFRDSILHQTQNIASIEDGLKEVQLANTIYLSAWKDQTISFPCDESEFQQHFPE